MVAPAKVRRPAISSARFEIDPVDGNDFFGLFVAFSFVEAWLEGCLSLLKLFVVDGFLSSACGLLLSGFGFSSCGLTSGFGFSGCGVSGLVEDPELDEEDKPFLNLEKASSSFD